MIFLTHISGALLLSIIVSGLLGVDSVLVIISAVAGSLFPDLDTPSSILGRKIKVLGFLADHRHFFHSISLCVILAFLIYGISENESIAIGFFIGFLSHILLDALTISGVGVFSPFSERKIRGPLRTNGVIEYIILALMLLGIWSLVSLGALRT
jgi:inner membrane protein